MISGYALLGLILVPMSASDLRFLNALPSDVSLAPSLYASAVSK
jgi:hypothetical protein